MFYSHDILQHRRGKFATVWLAATKMSQVSRREVMAVNVDSTCDAMLDYLFHRVSPTVSGKRPRLSLYLSAVLMHGVVRVHSKQHDYLLADISSIFYKLISKFQAVKDINLTEKPSAELVTFPEYRVDDLPPLDVDAELLLLDKEHLRDVHTIEYWGSSGQLTSPVTSTSTTSSKRKKRKTAEEPEMRAPSVTSIDQITLQEPPPLRLDTPMSPIPVPKDIELPMLDGTELEQLLGLTLNEPPLQVSDLLPTSTPLHPGQDRSRRTRQSRQDTDSRAGQELQAPEVTSELVLETANQVLLETSPQPTVASTSVPEARAVHASPGVTMNVITSPLPRRPAARHSLRLDELQEDVGGRRRTRKRKRRLLMVDQEIQVPTSKIKENFEASRQTCAELLLPNVHANSASDLLENPGRRELRREPFLTHWRRVARFRRNVHEDDMPVLRSPSPQRLLEEQPNLETLLQEQPVDVTMETLRPDIQQDMLQIHASPVLPDTTEKRRGRKRSSTVDESIEKMRQITSMSETAGIGELPSMELIRDASTSNLLPPGIEDTLILEESRHSQKDRSSTKKKRSRRSGVSEEGLIQESVSFTNIPMSATGSSSTHRGLYDVVEEHEPGVIPQLVDEQSESSVDELMGTIENEMRQQPGGDAGVWFGQLFPTHVIERKVAARHFCNLLVLCKEERVSAQQNVYGGDILIMRP